MNTATIFVCALAYLALGVIAGLMLAQVTKVTKHPGCHRLDTKGEIFYYENEFYPLSSFSAFGLHWKGYYFDTLEHAYHWEKFANTGMQTASEVAEIIRQATSAHEAFRLARENKRFVRPDWDDVRKPIMKELQTQKALQHEYVRRKLFESRGRSLIEDSWRDSFWGWGPDGKGENWNGRLWEEVREELWNSDIGVAYQRMFMKPEDSILGL